MNDQIFTYNIPQNLSLNTYAKTGYYFTGWNTTANGSGTSYTDGQNVNNLYTSEGVLRLYAQWEPHGFKVILDKQGGTDGTENVFVNYGQTMPSAIKPTKEGYVFRGYFELMGGQGVQYYTSDMNSATTYIYEYNITIYAHWEPTTYRVRFISNGGSGIMENQLFTYDEPQYLSPNLFVYEGYNFIGWKTQIDGHGVMYTNEQQVLNLTSNGGIFYLFAQWDRVVDLWM
jgi:uncharacterized repeat protein (TIGR02543 family)